MKNNRFSVESLNKIVEYWGDDPCEFSVQLQVEVSAEEGAGSEAFGVTIMSPAQLAREMESGSEEVELAHGCLFMLDYDERAVVEFLQRLITRSDATTWGELAQSTGRYFDWLD